MALFGDFNPWGTPFGSTTLPFGFGHSHFAHPAPTAFPFGLASPSTFGTPFPGFGTFPTAAAPAAPAAATTQFESNPFLFPQSSGFFGFPAASAQPQASAPAGTAAPAEAPAAPEAAEGQGEREAAYGQEEQRTQLTLGYWKIRGLAAPIRMLLAYKGDPYVDRFFSANAREDGSYDKSEWLDVKEGLRAVNPLVNLPYLEVVDSEGVLLLAQSNAIMAHLGRRFNLTGCTEVDAAKTDMLLNQCQDLRIGFSELCYASQDFANDVEAYFADGGSFQENMSKFEQWMELQNAEFLVENDHPIIADFVFWELCDIHLRLRPGCLELFPKVTAFYHKFRNLKDLQGYFTSELYYLPINNKMAHWTGEDAGAAEEEAPAAESAQDGQGEVASDEVPTA